MGAQRWAQRAWGGGMDVARGEEGVGVGRGSTKGGAGGEGAARREVWTEARVR